jgi:hypothetical protein
MYILVASEIGRGLAGALPFGRWWTPTMMSIGLRGTCCGKPRKSHDLVV